MTQQIPAGVLAELDQWEAGSRAGLKKMVATAVKYLDAGESSAAVAASLGLAARKMDPDQVASGLCWAVVLLAEQAREARS